VALLLQGNLALPTPPSRARPPPADDPDLATAALVAARRRRDWARLWAVYAAAVEPRLAAAASASAGGDGGGIPLGPRAGPACPPSQRGGAFPRVGLPSLPIELDKSRCPHSPRPQPFMASGGSPLIA